MEDSRWSGAAGDRARGLVDALCTARDAEHAAQVQQVELIGELCSEFATLDGVGPALPGRERLVPFGGDGAPLVAEHLATELAPKLRVTILAASVLISESLDVLYRHPRVWAATKEGRLPVWQAKQVASLTHAAGLSADATTWVDQQVEPALGRLPWGRLKRKLTGLIVRADTELAARRAQRAQGERFVRIRQNGDGTAFITARTDAADANRLHLTLTQLAGQLSLAGHTDSLDVLRAAVLGVLADPHAAVNLLAGPDTEPESDAVASAGHGGGQQGQDAGQDEETSAGQDAGQDEERSTGKDTSAAAGLRVAAGGSARRSRRGKARPTAELVIHLAPGSNVGRCEELGPVLAHQVKNWLGHHRVIVRPVIDLHDNPAVDTYEVPDTIARIARYRNPYDVFPWSSRASKHLDLDHTREFDHSPDAPHGRTCPDNLGPLSRRAHNAKTHADWHLEQPLPAVYDWISRLGYHYRVDHHGSHELPPQEQEDKRHRDRPDEQEGDRPDEQENERHDNRQDEQKDERQDEWEDSQEDERHRPDEPVPPPRGDVPGPRPIFPFNFELYWPRAG